MRYILSGLFVVLIACVLSVPTFAQTTPPAGSTATTQTDTDAGKLQEATIKDTKKEKDKDKDADKETGQQHSNKGGEVRGLDRADEVAGEHGAQGRANAREHAMPPPPPTPCCPGPGGQGGRR